MGLSAWGLWPRGHRAQRVTFTAEAEPPAVVLACASPDDSGDGVWPDDPDAVPAWVVRAEALRASLGIVDRLPARTKREWWQQVDLAEIAAAISVVKPAVELGAALPHDEAAREFLGSIQHDEIVGEYTAPEITEAYQKFCADRNLTPSPVDWVKAELALLPGVHKRTRDTKDPVTKSRTRTVLWVITPLCEMDHSQSTEEYRLAA